MYVSINYLGTTVFYIIINTLGFEQNAYRFADGIFKFIYILIQIWYQLMH